MALWGIQNDRTSYTLSVAMYGCESWTIKKAEHWRNDAFEILLEKTLESPWDSLQGDQTNQS